MYIRRLTKRQLLLPGCLHHRLYSISSGHRRTAQRPGSTCYCTHTRLPRTGRMVACSWRQHSRRFGHRSKPRWTGCFSSLSILHWPRLSMFYQLELPRLFLASRHIRIFTHSRLYYDRQSGLHVFDCVFFWVLLHRPFLNPRKLATSAHSPVTTLPCRHEKCHNIFYSCLSRQAAPSVNTI